MTVPPNHALQRRRWRFGLFDNVWIVHITGSAVAEFGSSGKDKMSRSYHITRKQADRAMDAGDLDPTWQASEKAWVKNAAEKERALGKTLKVRSKLPNRVIVAEEKGRTSRSKAKSGGLYDRLDSMIQRTGRAEPGVSPNSTPPHR